MSLLWRRSLDSYGHIYVAADYEGPQLAVIRIPEFCLHFPIVGQANCDLDPGVRLEIRTFVVVAHVLLLGNAQRLINIFKLARQ